MSDKDFELLIKMLGMTGSDNDNQCLVAMRKANDLAARLGGWDAILRGKVKITILADPFANMNVPEPMPNRFRPPEAPPRPAAPPPPPWTPSPPPRQQRSKPQPQPTNAKPFAEQVNRYEGTCVHCSRRVSAGDGIAFKMTAGGRWQTKHKPGQCPSAATRKTQAFTSDDLQI